MLSDTREEAHRTALLDGSRLRAWSTARTRSWSALGRWLVFGATTARALVLNGHVDTLALNHLVLWLIDPLAGTLRNGHLYGRWACDTEPGIGIAVGIPHPMAARRGQLVGSPVCRFAVGEEPGDPGALFLLKAGVTGKGSAVLEPAQLHVPAAPRGTSDIRAHLGGSLMHTSNAALGVNPLLRIRAVVDALDDCDRALLAAQALPPGGWCSPTTVRGGSQKNLVPDTVAFILDCRPLPDEDSDADHCELTRGVQGLSYHRAPISVGTSSSSPRPGRERRSRRMYCSSPATSGSVTAPASASRRASSVRRTSWRRVRKGS